MLLLKKKKKIKLQKRIPFLFPTLLAKFWSAQHYKTAHRMASFNVRIWTESTGFTFPALVHAGVWIDIQS